MNYKWFCVLPLLVAVCFAQAMNNVPAPTMPHFEPVVQRKVANNLLSYFVPSRQAIKGCLIATALQSGLSWVNHVWYKTPYKPLFSSVPLRYKMLFYGAYAINSGLYVVDEERGGRRCYAMDDYLRYQKLTCAPEQRFPDAPEKGLSSRRVLTSAVQTIGEDIAVSKLLSLAGSLSMGQKAGALLACGLAKPGMVGLAAMVGSNLATVLGCALAGYAVKQLIVKPVVKPAICYLSRLWTLPIAI